MAKERDYAKEWAREKEYRQLREKMVGAKLDKQVADDFEAKCTLEGLTKNTVLKQFILEYTYGEKAAEMAKPARQRKNPDRDLER